MDNQMHSKHMERCLLRICKGDTTVLISPERYRKIVDVLSGKWIPDSSFKFWLNKKKFQLIDNPSTNETDVLVAPGKISEEADEIGYVRVLRFEEIYPAIWEIHANEQDHAGYRKCFQRANSLYYRIPRSYIQEFIRSCPICLHNRKHLESRSTSFLDKDFQPVVLEKLKLNILNISCVSSEGYTHVGMVEDMYSKFIVLFPLKSANPKDVAHSFCQYYLGIFGPPTSFLSDNGHEFMDQVLNELSGVWSGFPLKLQNETPHEIAMEEVSQRSNIVTETLNILISEQNNGECAWHNWLPDIALRLNATQSELRQSPYTIMFGTDVQYGNYGSNIINKCSEETSTDSFINKTERPDDADNDGDDVVNSTADLTCSTTTMKQEPEETPCSQLQNSTVKRKKCRRQKQSDMKAKEYESPANKLPRITLPFVPTQRQDVKAAMESIMNTEKIRRLKKTATATSTSSDLISDVDSFLEESDDNLTSSAESSSDEEDVDVLDFLTRGLDKKKKLMMLKKIVTSLVLRQNRKKSKKKKRKK